MRTVALVGFSEDSWGPAFDLPDHIELWTVNHAYRLGIPRIDRLFEMHPIEHIKDKNYYARKDQKRHIEYLTNATHPIYMLQQYSEFPSCIRYPIEDVIALDPHANFRSSFDYMIALAILEGDIDRIESYGFDMSSTTEWAYQRSSAISWIRFARGKGIEVTGKGSILEKRKLYGYEAAEMVSRQTLEEHKKQYKKQYQENLTRLNIFEGRWQEAVANKSGNGNIEMLGAKVREWTIATAAADAGIQVCDNFIKVCDMDEVEPILINREAA